MEVQAKEGATFDVKDTLLCPDCGKRSEVGGYVAAHWDLELTNHCECGRRTVIEGGMVVVSDNLPD